MSATIVRVKTTSERATTIVGLLIAALSWGCREQAPAAMPGTTATTSTTAAGGAGGDGGHAGTGAAGGSGGSQSGGGGSYQGEGPPAEIASTGAEGKLLLRGTVLTPTEVIDGEVLIDGDTIACVAESCAGEPAAASATVVDTHAVILPGLIDTHNHILFDVFDESDWSPEKAYGNHEQWTNEAKYGALVDAKQYLNGEAGSPISLNCELIKYGELKGLIAGTTSIAGSANPANKVCYRTLARTIDQSANGLCGTVPPQSCPDEVQANTLFPSASSANQVCENFTSGKTKAYLIHLGEGVDEKARSELDDMVTVTTPDGCLLSPHTTVIHGTAFGDPELSTLAQAGVGLSWSPRSNVFLYGGGNDLSKTTNIPLALAKGMTVALSPDWSIGGSANLLDELRFAAEVDDSQWGDTLSHQELVEMVTSNAAKLLFLDGQIGRLAKGMKADIAVIGGDVSKPYEAVVRARAQNVRLTIVDGRVLYGDAHLGPLGPSGPACDALEVCGRAKFACVAVDGGDDSNKFGQTLADIDKALSDGLSAYDALDLSPYDFSPIAPLARCE